MFGVKVIIWMVYLAIVLSAPTDEFRSIIDDAEYINSNDDHRQGIVPGTLGGPAQKAHRFKDLKAYLEYNKDYKIFMDYVNNGVTSPGRTFNIYDDDMREAALLLFGLIRSTSNLGFDTKELFNSENINTDLVNYSFDLNMLYGEKHSGKFTFMPPFISRPNHFVNGETIVKALKISNLINYNIKSFEDAQVNQYFKTADTVVINTNYSRWYLQSNGGEDVLNYFTEDISLNSYYYGVHLMHPYWLQNDELEEVHPRHNERYYFGHQQLFARFLLEKEHIKQSNILRNITNCEDFDPCLIHGNGLPFPHRSKAADHYFELMTMMKPIDIAIRECMDRGLIIMANATTINMTEDNYIKLLVKLVRANYESTKMSKVVRNVLGHGGRENTYSEYDIAPSVLHYPETSLRDPIYWYLMEFILKYFTEYKGKMKPYNIGEFETDNFTIVEANIPKISTYFDYYQFNINSAVSNNIKLPITICARQKRLKHSQFTLTFTVESKVVENVIVRLFLGPPCDDCWAAFSQFYELDIFEFYLQKGVNFIKWSPDTSKRFSSDEYYNLEGSPLMKNKTNMYNIFKFPENLLIPKGLKNGLNLTLFIMITSTEDVFDSDFSPPTNFYRSLNNELDTKPLGFPFHRASCNQKDTANNYKFYKILVHHKQNNVASNGYFSPHLY